MVKLSSSAISLIVSAFSRTSDRRRSATASYEADVDVAVSERPARSYSRLVASFGARVRVFVVLQSLRIPGLMFYTARNWLGGVIER